MQISVIGSSYVGTTIAACFVDMDHDVVNVDLDEDIVDAINRGEAPIHEDGHPELVDAYVGDDGADRLSATANHDAVFDTDVTFLCLPTPQNDDGSIDLSIMEAGAIELGETLAAKDDWHTVVVKSTVVPGTTEEVVTALLAAGSEKAAGEGLRVSMNPEFLREDTAVAGFLNPDKVVLDADDIRNARSIPVIESLLARDTDVVAHDPAAAEHMRDRFPGIEYADSSKASELLGYEPSRTIREGVAEFVNLYHGNRNWYEPLVLGS